MPKIKHLVCLIGILLFSNLSGMLLAQEFVLWSIPPVDHLDWSTPRAIFYTSTIANRITFHHVGAKHVIGHVFIELRDQNGKRVLAGSTGAPDAPADSDFLLKDGYGLGIFFARFKGALDSTDTLIKQIQDRSTDGRISFIRYKVSQTTFDRLSRYLREYQERGYDKIYGGLNKPREGQGAGCSIFGISFLELAGLMRQEFVDKWQIHVKLPKCLTGGPITGQKVSMWAVLTENRWAKEGEEFLPIDLYDPDLIFSWIQNVWNQENFSKGQKEANPQTRSLYGNIELDSVGQAHGLVYDCRNVPTPTEPIFLDKK
ncbi:MAG: hypothetical protein HQM08_14205 [Candidatus Riflebacteria bacterium]|nr:hypothetical protein [Candidatus Riflebacteria bacterium]